MVCIVFVLDGGAPPNAKAGAGGSGSSGSTSTSARGAALSELDAVLVLSTCTVCGIHIAMGSSKASSIIVFIRGVLSVTSAISTHTPSIERIFPLSRRNLIEIRHIDRLEPREHGPDLSILLPQLQPVLTLQSSTLADRFKTRSHAMSAPEGLDRRRCGRHLPMSTCASS
jgi:hypothetical protein